MPATAFTIDPSKIIALIDAHRAEIGRLNRILDMAEQLREFGEPLDLDADQLGLVLDSEGQVTPRRGRPPKENPAYGPLREFVVSRSPDTVLSSDDLKRVAAELLGADVDRFTLYDAIRMLISDGMLQELQAPQGRRRGEYRLAPAAATRLAEGFPVVSLPSGKSVIPPTSWGDTNEGD